MTAHPNPDTCTVGFNGSLCPACWHAQRVAQSDNHIRREVCVWLAEATELQKSDALAWFVRHDLDALRDAIAEVAS